MFKRYQRLANDVVGLVNSPRSLQGRLRDSVAPRPARERLLHLARQAHGAGLAAGLLSEASIRLKGQMLLLTGPGCWFADAGEDALVVCSLEGQPFPEGAELPQHSAWHCQLYRQTAARAVLLAQPAAVLAAAAERDYLPPDVLPDAAALLGPVAIIEAAPTLPEPLSEAGLYIIRGCGLLAWGPEGAELLARSHAVMRWAEVLLMKEVTGK